MIFTFRSIQAVNTDHPLLRPEHIFRTLSVGALAPLVVLALGAPCSTAHFVFESYWPGPVTDYWMFLPTVASFWQGDWSLQDLLKPHGGHRHFFPRLLLLLDYLLVSGRNIFVLLCSFLLQLLTATILVRGICQQRRTFGWQLTLFLVALTIVLLFSATQLENFVHAWNVCFYVTIAAATASLRALVCAHEGLLRRETHWLPRAWLAAAFASAIVASYSMINGLLVWPALVVVGFTRRCSGRWIALFLIGAFVVAGLYFIDYPRRTLAALELLNPREALWWITAYLGAPLSREYGTWGRILGGVAIVLSAALLVRLIIWRPNLTPIESVCLGLLVVTLGTAGMTTSGRIYLSGGWSAPRYQSFVLLFWLCLAVLGSATPISRPGVRYGLRFLLMVAGIAWVAFVLRPAESEQVKRITSFAREARLANAAIVVGVQDAPELRVVRGMTATWNVARSIVFLREEGLGPFADKRASLLGTRLGYPLKPVRDPGCHGKGMEVTRLPQSGALRVRGWASPGAKRALPWALVATNEAGDVVGLGESESELGMDGYYWILYSRPPQQAGGLVVWAVRDEYEVCLVTHLQVNSAVH